MTPAAESEARLRACAQVSYFHTDPSGLPEEVTDASGEVRWRASYRTWGSALEERWDAVRIDGSAVPPAQQRHAREEALEQNLRLQGQYLDRETGLHYNPFRYYDPDVGRFVSPDPIGLNGGLNLQRYAPNPVSWIDPWGWEHHTATITVYARDGSIRYSEPLVSGGATGRSWSEQIASHTESKSIKDPRIQPGDRVVYTEASLPACSGCRGNMNNAAAEKGLSIEYYWSDGDGKSGSWTTNAEDAQKAVDARNRRNARKAAKAGKGNC